jgi:signal transduction histidine kinase
VAFRSRILLRITLPALLIGVALIAACVLAARSLNQLQLGQERLLAHEVAGLQAAQRLERLLRQLRFHALVYVVEPTNDERRQMLLDDQREFETTLNKAVEAADEPAEQALLEAVASGYRKYRHEIDDRSRWPKPDASAKEALAWADEHPVRHLLDPCEELLQAYRESITATRRDSDQLTARTRWAMIVLAVVGALGGLVAGAGSAWGLSRSFARLRLQIQAAQRELDLGSVQVAAVGASRDLDDLMAGVLARVREVVAQLQEQERERLRSEQMAALGQLAAGVAHEIRNPLTGVKMLVEVALRPSSPGLPRNELEMIRTEIQRVERTVQGLLDFARSSSTTADRRSHDLGQLIRHAADAVKPRADQNDVRIELDVPDGALLVRADRDNFLSLLTNLLINGVEATPAHGTVRIVAARDGGENITVRVTDTGPGIAPAVAERLFTPFATTKPTGTGLGLSVARRIAQDHGGSLTATNMPGGGACFTLTVPAWEGSDAEIAGRG